MLCYVYAIGADSCGPWHSVEHFNKLEGLNTAWRHVENLLTDDRVNKIEWWAARPDGLSWFKIGVWERVGNYDTRPEWNFDETLDYWREFIVCRDGKFYVQS